MIEECDAVLEAELEGELIDAVCVLKEPHDVHYDGREWAWGEHSFWREYR